MKIILLYCLISLIATPNINAQKIKDFVGTWDLIRIENDKETINKKDVEKLEVNYIKAMQETLRKTKGTLTTEDNNKIFKEAEDYFKRLFGFSMFFNYRYVYSVSKWNTDSLVWITEKGSFNFNETTKILILNTSNSKNQKRIKTVTVQFLTPRVMKLTEKRAKSDFVLVLQRDEAP